MIVVLDSGGLTSLAGDRDRLRRIRDRSDGPPLVPTVVLAESLTGDHRRDFHTNRLLRTCDVRAVTEALARSAATLRAAAAKPGVSGIDAVVVATADRPGGSVVLTSDPEDLRALAAHTANPVSVERC